MEPTRIAVRILCGAEDPENRQRFLPHNRDFPEGYTSTPRAVTLGQRYTIPIGLTVIANC